MIAILRQYALVLWAIVSRPWTLLMLGMGLLYVGPTLGGGAWMNRGISHDTFPLFPNGWRNLPPAMGRDRVVDGGMATTTGWDGRWRQPPPSAKPRDLPFDTDRDWPILDQLPALEWLVLSHPNALSAAGWKRIGEQDQLRELSLVDVVTDDDAPTEAPKALGRLHRLERLDFRPSIEPKPFPHPNKPIVLPPLPSLEVAVLDSRSLEENLAALAAGAPRLHTLGLYTGPEDFNKRWLIPTLKRLPQLRTLYVGGNHDGKDDSRYRDHLADLRQALPGVAVFPGTYAWQRIAAASIGAIGSAYFPFVLWFQAGILLATPLAWMMPRRLLPHLFWPLAVAVLIGGVFVAIARSAGVAWMPATTLAVFVTGLAAYGPVSGDIDGLAARITRLIVRLDILAVIMLAVMVVWAGPVFDRWLSGDMPLRSAALLAMVAGTVGWKLARLSRLPVILAGAGKSLPPGLVLEPFPSAPREQGSIGSGSFDLSRWLNDVSVDRQLGRGVPATFASMLRRAQSRHQIPLMLGVMLIVEFAVLSLILGIMARGTGQAMPSFLKIAQMALVVFAWQGFATALAMTIGLWHQRRASLVVDFLRPVSREGFWRGLRQAITRDLFLPAAFAAICLVVGIVSAGNGVWWAWVVAGMAFVGGVSMAHALTLLLAVTRWPLVVGTLTVVLLVATTIGSLVAMTQVVSISKPADLHTALVAAGAVLAVGLSIRTGVLWRLEGREIG